MRQESVCYAVCAASCLECLTNGAGKCDRDKCGPQTAYDSTTMTCKGYQDRLQYFIRLVKNFLDNEEYNVISCGNVH